MSDSEIKTSYTVYYEGDRPCDVVYVTDAIRRVARDTPIRRVIERKTEWFGDWDTDTRRYQVKAERVMSDDEY